MIFCFIFPFLLMVSALARAAFSLAIGSVRFFPPVFLEVFNRGDQFRQHIGGVNQIHAVEGLGVTVERGYSVVSWFGSNPLIVVSCKGLQQRQSQQPLQAGQRGQLALGWYRTRLAGLSANL